MSRPGTNGVELEVDGQGIGIITLDHFPVNSLGAHIRNGVVDCATRAMSDPNVKAIVLRGAGRTFCAGADIGELGRTAAGAGPEGKHSDFNDVVYSLERGSKPVVAAIHGFALGGGMEISLGCHYRVVANNASIGLPEVNIGLLPGGQGTQRLPRLVGAQAALEVMLTGMHVPAKKALSMKLADEIVPPDQVLEAAKRLALSKVGEDLSSRRISDLRVPPPPAGFFPQIRQQMAKQRRGEVAPIEIIKAVEAAATLPTFAEGIAAEARGFRTVMKSKEAKALQYMFFQERAAATVPGLKAKPKPVKSVGVLGAGTMGGGIAMCFANIGIPVFLLDRESKLVEKGLQIIRSNYERTAKRGGITQKQLEGRMNLIKGTTSYESFADCDLVIEAVYEDIQIKKDVFTQLDRVCKPGALLCTNTSGLDVDVIASATQRPQDCVGMHFFSPANVMKLLENVRGKESSPTTIATVMSIGKAIGKWPVLAGNCPGFIGNRMLKAYSAEARLMVNEGALPWKIDEVSYAFGMPMGPFRMSDLVGLDIFWQGKKKRGQSDPEGDLTDALCEAGRWGQKRGRGWYTYDQATRAATPDPEVESMITTFRTRGGFTPRSISDEEIVDRLFLGMVNEGFKILEEGIALRPSDIDVTFIHGYGFPRYTGGPMFWADAMGLDKVLAKVRKYHEHSQAMNRSYKGYQPAIGWWDPAPLLLEAAGTKGGLAAHWAKRGKAKL